MVQHYWKEMEITTIMCMFHKKPNVVHRTLCKTQTRNPKANRFSSNTAGRVQPAKLLPPDIPLRRQLDKPI